MVRSSRMCIPLLVLLSGLLVATWVQAEPVKLAVLLPSSNVYKDQGNDAKQGFLLGIQEEVQTQKIPWESWVTLDFFDTRVNKDHALQVAKDAIASGAKAILGPAISSGVCVNLQDYVLDEAGVPLIVLGGCASAKLRTTHPLFIRTTRSVPLFTAALSTWLTENPIVSAPKPRWACIHSDYTWGIETCNAFKRYYGEVGEEIGRVPIPLKTVEKKRYIAQLAKLKPDFAVAVLSGAENDTFFPAYYRFKVHEKVPLIAPSFASVTDRRLQTYEKTLSKYGTGVGMLTAAPYDPTADNAANRHFVAAYQRAYGTLPATASMWGYDAGRLLVKALVEIKGQWDGVEVVRLMKTLPYTSPRHGQQLKFDSHGDALNGVFIIKVKRDGDRLVREVIDQVQPINMDEVLK